MSAAVAEIVILGKTLAIDADGNLANLSDWNQEIAGELAKEEGILVGISSGAAVAGAIALAGQLGAGKSVVTIAPDNGERYLSTPVFQN